MGRFFFNRKTLGSDLIAGLTLGIESVPDGMASGLLAAVNPIYGVYGYMLGTFTGAFFTSSVFMAVQAPSAMALIVAGVPQVHGDENALESLVALTILTGIFIAIMGLLKFGRFLRFVSHTVMTGFITGVGVLTILGQFDNLTGYTSEGPNRLAKTLDLFFNLNQIDLQALFVGIVTILSIMILERTRLKSLGLVAAIFLASLVPAVFNWEGVAQVGDLAEISGSLPLPILPPLSVFPALILPAISLALVALVQGSGVSQAYPNPDGQYPDVDQDFIGQGIANIGAGLFQGIPVSGSFSATALSVDSGAKTRLALISAGITMAIVLLVFGDLISFLALPALAGLLIVIGFRIIKPDDIRLVWGLGTYHHAILLITFILTLIVPLQYAVFIGMALSILVFVTRQSEKIKVMEWIREPGELPIEQDAPSEVPSDKVTVLIPYGSLFYAAVQRFEEALPEVTEQTHHAVVILSLRQRDDLGSTFLNVLERYAQTLRAADSKLMLVEISDKTMDRLENTGQLDAEVQEDMFRATDRPYESMRLALDQAEKWIAEKKGG